MSNKTNLSAGNLQTDANMLEYIMQQALITQINTFMPAIIDSVNEDGTYDVQPTLNYLKASGEPIQPTIIPKVPVKWTCFGNAGIRGKYVKGDAVLLGIIQRDITTLSKNWKKIVNPSSFRKFALPDAIILDSLRNSPPTTFIEFKDGEIAISATTVNVDGDLIINGVPYENHIHEAGELQAPNGQVTGNTGVVSS